MKLDPKECITGARLIECSRNGQLIRLLKSPWSGNTYVITHVKGSGPIKLSGEFSDAVVLNPGEQPGVAGCLVIPIASYCYGENEVGPFMIRESSVKLIRGNGELTIAITDSGDYCGSVIALTRDPNALSRVLSRLPKPLPLLHAGFFEDGLIWAMVRAGYVKESELPSFIRPGQAYYWARGDIVNPALVGFIEEGNPVYLDILVLAYEELLSLMNEYGGVKIPYITAARARDIYGSPQQTYTFNTLLRGYELTGDSRYLNGALKALNCYNTQPPNCLGYIDLGGGLRWFRWGSRHFLSTDPQGWENLMVLNTHLMAVLSFSEAYVRGLCSDCLNHALSGVNAVIKLSRDFQRGDGYLYYSLYSKAHMGSDEDDKYPPYRGYSLLSSRLALKASIYLNNAELYSIAAKACLMGYRRVNRVIGGRWTEYEAVARCLSLMYLKDRDQSTLNKLLRVMRRALSKGVSIRVLGYDVETALYAQYQPATLIQGNAQLTYIGPINGEVALVAYSRGGARIKFSNYQAPSGHGVTVKQVTVDNVDGSSRVSGNEVEFRGGVLMRISEDVSKPAMGVKSQGP